VDLFTDKPRPANAATNDINQCINRFVGAYGETDKARLDENTIKMITGDDTMTYRMNYGEAGKVRLFMKLVLSGNHKPDWSHNKPMAKRMAFFYFVNRFVDNPTKATEHKKDGKKVAALLKGKGRNQMFSLLVRNAASLYKRHKLHKSKFMDRAFKDYINEVDTTTEFINTSIQKKAGGGMTIGQIFDKYKLWCNDNNSCCEKKGVFSRKFKERIPSRATLLHGNTVYDVVLVSDVKKVESMFVNPDKLDDYMREENKALLNEMEEVVWERDLATEEREELEDALEKTLDVIEMQQREILELKKQMQKFYRQGTAEKELQKSVYANVAKQAQGMMKHRSKRNRKKLPVRIA
jgi:phage/plasmid-associated DNA primase